MSKIQRIPPGVGPARYLGLPEPAASEPLTLLGTPLPGAKVQKAAEEAKEAKDTAGRQATR
jgi:hypothetical protein